MLNVTKWVSDCGIIDGDAQKIDVMYPAIKGETEHPASRLKASSERSWTNASSGEESLFFQLDHFLRITATLLFAACVGSFYQELRLGGELCCLTFDLSDPSFHEL